MNDSVPMTGRCDTTPDRALPLPDPPVEGGSAGALWPGSLMEAMRMELVLRSPSRTVISMPVEGNTQPAGLLHGGASAALAETAASLAAQIHARAVHGRDRGVAVGTELSISHIRPVRSGTVTAEAVAAHLGSSSTVHLVEIRAEDGRLVSSARVTNRILSRAQSARSEGGA